MMIPTYLDVVDCNGFQDWQAGWMRRSKMAVVTVLTVALMMAWVVPAIAEEIEKVNINHASKEDLEMLYGIGEKIADRIIKYRKNNGPFQKPEDIMMVKGIGRNMFEKNKEVIHIR
jgi:competence protein ComEA